MSTKSLNIFEIRKDFQKIENDCKIHYIHLEKFQRQHQKELLLGNKPMKYKILQNKR